MDSESKRASILRMVLDFINNGDWQEGEGYLIFGLDGYDKHLGIDYGDNEQTAYDEFLRKLATGIKKVGGAHDIAKRISLSPVSLDYGDLDLKSFFDNLSPDERAQLARTISTVAEDLARSPKPETKQIRDTSDDIDATLAEEAIDFLEKSYRRLVTLDEMSRPATAFDGSEYFEEAHRCELAGQKIAAAVLCRAVLEAALTDATDQDRWIKEQTTAHQRSYIEAMLSQARFSKLIDGSRFKQGLQVRDAGNAAIHDLLEFHHKFANAIPEIIDGTRKIVEDLFSSRTKN